jgi:hypothetical protein
MRVNIPAVFVFSPSEAECSAWCNIGLVFVSTRSLHSVHEVMAQYEFRVSIFKLNLLSYTT